MAHKNTITNIQNKKKTGKKITMLTAYDHFMGKLVDEAGIDAILVGDSLGMVVLGHESTNQVTMQDMIRHAGAVRTGTTSALLIGDMPYRSFDDPAIAVKNAKRLVREGGCDAVKLEGESYGAASAILKEGIPVLGHLGLTPQTAKEFKVQGKDAAAAKAILKSAKRLEALGCFALVLECVPAELAGMITARLAIPTIGIGAGADCDGQVLVLNDILGLYDKFRPRFAKRYTNLAEPAMKAISSFKEEVEDGRFPKREHSFIMKKEELEKLK
ncbi:MAG: 3-methyl-2-oxobutanoate hydroxymethyltransferase [Candidatus Omnitrophica bacterium]|nr:3-methyl-2-oxobutanoate hydroxymethyltransferase [Candidatus Omnitrophota bacterium]